MDVFTHKDYGIPPCTYLKRQVQDSRGRKPVYMCSSSDGQYIAVLYVSRSNRSIKKSFSYFDRIVSLALKRVLNSKDGQPTDITKLTNNSSPSGNYKSYLDFITTRKEFDIYDEVELIDEEPDKLNKFKESSCAFIKENIAIDIDASDDDTVIVIYDTFFLNPVKEIRVPAGILPAPCYGSSGGAYPEERSDEGPRDVIPRSIVSKDSGVYPMREAVSGNSFPHPAIGGGSASGFGVYPEERSDEGARDVIPRSIVSEGSGVYPDSGSGSGILPEPCYRSSGSASTKDGGVHPEERGSTPKSEHPDKDSGVYPEERAGASIESIHSTYSRVREVIPDLKEFPRGSGRFIKFSIGDLFILCFIDNRLWVIYDGEVLFQLDLSLVNSQFCIVDVDLISVKGDGDIVNFDIRGSDMIMWEFIIHYENQFPIRVMYCQNLVEKTFHIKTSDVLIPNIATEKTKCIGSHLLLDFKYLYYVAKEGYKEGDKIWIDESDQLVVLDHLIGIKGASEKFLVQNEEQKYVEKEFYSKFLMINLIRQNSQQANLLLVLSDMDCVALSSIKMPMSTHPYKIKTSHNRQFICCLSRDSVVVAMVKSSHFRDEEQSLDTRYELILLFVLDPNVDETIGRIADASFGGDPLSEWFYISLYRGASNGILSIYNLKKLELSGISTLTKYNKPHLELNLNTNMIPVCLQMISIPCTNLLLTIPLHSRYIAVFAPEYMENWDNTATLNFMRFPLFSSNKEMIQLSSTWEDDFLSEIGNGDKIVKSVLPSLTEPLFAYNRGCDSTDSHIAQLASLNVEINSKQFASFCSGCGLYSIWPYIEHNVTSVVGGIKAPPLRRARLYSNSLRHEDVKHIASIFLGEIITCYKKGLLDDNWLGNIVLQNGNELSLLVQALGYVGKGLENMYITQLDGYIERLRTVEECWLERIKERGIAVLGGRSCLDKGHLGKGLDKNLGRPYLGKGLDKTYLGKNIGKNKYLSKMGTLEVLMEYYQDKKEIGDKRPLGAYPKSIKKANRESVRGKKKVRATSSDNSSELFSIIPKNKLYLSGIDKASINPILKSADSLKRSSAEIFLGILYLKNALERNKIDLPPKLSELINFLEKTSIAHHKHINNT